MPRSDAQECVTLPMIVAPAQPAVRACVIACQ
jgi:hypothetical protein